MKSFLQVIGAVTLVGVVGFVALAAISVPAQVQDPFKVRYSESGVFKGGNVQSISQSPVTIKAITYNHSTCEVIFNSPLPQTLTYGDQLNFGIPFSNSKCFWNEVVSFDVETDVGTFTYFTFGNRP